MKIPFGLALCLAYLWGLLLSAIASSEQLGDWTVSWASMTALIGLIGWGMLTPRRWHCGWSVGQWCSLGGIVLLATLYITIRSPVAGATEISHFIARAEAIAPSQAGRAIVHRPSEDYSLTEDTKDADQSTKPAHSQIIIGRLIDEPRLNRALRGRFLVAVNQLQILDGRDVVTFQVPVRGRTYVTAPLLQITGLHQGQLIEARGYLYQPQPAMNPNGFDFQAYLAQRGAFTGFVAEELRFQQASVWGLWQVRQRIVRAQVQALGSPLGQLVSAMSLGRKAVDLPTDIQAVFAQVGLAHTIAASGFHVSLLLGTVLALLRSRTGMTQLAVGGGVLLGYVTLTGLQLSVMRAALMGLAMLVGIAMDRRVIPSGALIMAATGILLINPCWIWNVGFQLSVMATWGLIVTVPAIVRRLDWLPVTLASLIAVPIAATVWTLPLTLYHFNMFAGLSIVLNVATMPLVTVISLGGIVSSAAALIWPTAGAAIASLLHWPAQLLLWLAQTSSHLPGSSIAIGQINLWQLTGLYALLFSSLFRLRQAQHWLKPLTVIAFLSLILMPIGWRALTQHQITVLATGGDLVWVQQHHGQTTLVSSGDRQTAFYTVEPFLTQAGVNTIEQAIAPNLTSNAIGGWQSLLTQATVKHFYSSEDQPTQITRVNQWHRLTPGKSSSLTQLTVQPLGTENPILRLSGQRSWLLLPRLSLDVQEHLAGAGTVLQSDVLVWPGGKISAALLQAIRPQTVICYGRDLPELVERDLRQMDIRVFWTQRDGAITWQSRQGFHSYLEAKHRNALPWG
ncbi:MAG: ComEC/Rec2 family competence protein [Cyanobacteria bacterium P01_H01_bin.153]